MKLTLKREIKGIRSTIGKLYVDEDFFCYTLEDRVREGEKVYGETAIPAGTYEVIIDHSQRFGKKMPHILNVPGFEGIRIHVGNRPEDTNGCILVGKMCGPDFIGGSRTAYQEFFDMLEAGLEEGKVFITIE